MNKLLRALLLMLCVAPCAVMAATVDINTADAAELEQIKGLGPAKARAIVEYREANGPFARVAELKKVAGIGDKTLQQIRRKLTAGPAADGGK